MTVDAVYLITNGEMVSVYFCIIICNHVAVRATT